MSKSIMQTEKECFITHSTTGLHKHHIFGGANKNKSEKWGCWVYLRHEWHNTSNLGVHCGNTSLALELKQLCQLEFEKLYGHEKFMEEFGRNYLDG